MYTKKWALLLCATIALSGCAVEKKPDPTIRVMTFNIRVNLSSDGDDAWPNRKDFAAGMIRFHRADIIGLQEALYEQVNDLAERLPQYTWFGVGRDDGDRAGEFMAIFYLQERFHLLDSATFWLSENPRAPGKGWDAACNRVVTWGRFKDRASGKTFYHFNTHFDHIGEIARRESAGLLRRQIQTIAGDAEVIVTGDFNATPTSIPYQILTQNGDGTSAIGLTDAKTVSVTPHHGPNGTFTGFRISSLSQLGGAIDYIFITDRMKVLSHGTLSDTFDGRFPSDHLPVLAEIVLP